MTDHELADLDHRLGQPPPRIPARLAGLLGAEAPRFSPAEMTRRRSLLSAAMDEAGASIVLLIGTDKRGSALQWFTGYPSNNLNYGIVSAGAPDALFVPYPNQVAQARVIAADADIRWGAKGTQALVLDELMARGARGATVGVVGLTSPSLYATLARDMRLVDLNRAYQSMRVVKSDEEFDWAIIGAAFSDLGMEALARDIRPGMTEHELAAIIERSYMPWGGVNQIHFVGLTAMDNPDCSVPSQFPRARRVAPGDVVFSEISASFWGYAGQVLRTFAVDADPPALYRELYAVAEAAFDAVLATLRPGTSVDEILDAAALIGGSGFTICDDLVHGYVGGYLPPVLGTRERPSGPIPDLRLGENMAVVVQPSIVTRDGRAGVQIGECVRITRTGTERLHHAGRGFRRVGV